MITQNEKKRIRREMWREKERDEGRKKLLCAIKLQ